MALTWIKLQDSFLSPEVQQLIQMATPELGEEKGKTGYYWIKHDNGINWEKLETVFDDAKNEMGSKAWFHEVIEQLTPLFGECYNLLQYMYPTSYNESMKLFLEWTHQEREIDLCIKLISKESDNSDHLAALLTITALVERSLGNVVMLKRKQVPFLLRDLLATPELEEIIGKTKVKLLLVMLGSVLGLNLRNIAWHGFLSPHETSPAFVATIIFILIECGKILQGKKIHSRPQISFEEAKSLSNVFEEMILPERPVLEDIIKNSGLVPVVMYPAWIKALDLLENKNWGLCITLLLPLLESSMRGMFAVVNSASERVLTAENSTLYTTMDEILSEYVESDANKEQEADDGNADTAIKSINWVHHAIGTKVNEALHDLLNFIHGPRIRDKVSHGEAKLHEIQSDITIHILYCSLLVLSSDFKSLNDDDTALVTSSQIKPIKDPSARNLDMSDIGRSLKKECHQFCLLNEICNCSNSQSFINMSDLSDNSQKTISSLKTCISQYRCIYHPSSILQKRLIHTVSHLLKWKQWDRVSYEEIDYPQWESWNTIDFPEHISYPPLQAVHTVYEVHEIQKFLDLVKNIEYKVLYRPRQEIELLSILQRITSCISSALEMTCENMSAKYLLYVNKKLRSRQRDTYQRQLTAIPIIVLNCLLTSQVTYLIFLAINKSGDLDQSSFSNLKRVLKPILKVTENLVSQTSLSVNRWDEAVSNSMANIKHIKQSFC